MADKDKQNDDRIKVHQCESALRAAIEEGNTAQILYYEMMLEELQLRAQSK